MQLFYKEYPGPGATIIIMHGLFGMLDNWHNVAKKLSERYRVFSLDLRNHGQSPHSDDMSFELMAGDLNKFMEEKSIPSASIMGHSLGGKVAMEFALQYPEKTENLVVVDIAPIKYKAGHTEIFEALFKLDISDEEKKRSDLDKELAEMIPEFSVRQFLLKSLERNPEGGYSWKFNLQVLYDQYDKLISGIADNRTYPGPALFIAGGNSPYIKKEHEGGIEKLFPNFRITTIADAGHWVHAEKPGELIEALDEFL